MAITSATENFTLMENADGVLGLSPTSSGNHYGNILPFLKASGDIIDDNFSFDIDDSMAATKLLIDINMKQLNNSVSIDLPVNAKSWTLPLLYTNVEQDIDNEPKALAFDYNVKHLYIPPDHIENMKNDFPFKCDTKKEDAKHTILDCECNPNSINLDPIQKKNPDNLPKCSNKPVDDDNNRRSVNSIDDTDEAKNQDIVINNNSDDP
jgi:hypothetical protein